MSDMSETNGKRHDLFTYEQLPADESGKRSWKVSCKAGDFETVEVSRSAGRKVANLHKNNVLSQRTVSFPPIEEWELKAEEVNEGPAELVEEKVLVDVVVGAPEAPKPKKVVRRRRPAPEAPAVPEVPVVVAHNREEWLRNLIEELRHLYHAELPERVWISTGFTSKGVRSKRVGECWRSENSADGTPHVFVHPNQDDAVEVAAIVAHELIHACRPDAKHGPDFKAVALSIGLEGRMTSTTPGERFKTLVAPILANIGPYPHSKLTPGVGSNGPKQPTRMLKRECPECGYTVRLTQKWVDIAEPKCPIHEEELIG